MSKKGSITTADYLPFDEFQKLVKHLVDDHEYMWATYCMLSFCLGLRSSDVRTLKWGDVLNQRSVIVTEKKTQKTKPIPIGLSTSQKISELYELMNSPRLGKYIFATEKSGKKPVSIQYINRIAKSWKQKYNVPIENFSTHTFRKTFGRYVFEKRNKSNEALIELCHFFRHSSLKITMVYIGISDDNLFNVFDSIQI